MKKISILIFLALILSFNSFASSLPASDEKAIRAVWKDFEVAYNRNDVKKLSSLWFENGDLFTLSGGIFRGRDEIAGFFSETLSKNYKNSKFELVIDQIRKIKEDVAIVDGSWKVSGKGLPKGYKVNGIYTQILMKSNNKWLIVAARPSIPLKGHTRNHGRKIQKKIIE